MGKILVVLVGLVSFAVNCAAAERSLNVKDPNVIRQEVGYSMMGPRDTLVFYIFPKEAAVLVLKFNNKESKIPVTATLRLFDEETEESGLKDWVNNQHSDGLVPEVPKPVQGLNLPPKSFKISKKTLVKKQDFNNQRYAEYQVDFTMKAFASKDEVKLARIEDSVTVRVPE